MLAHKYYNSAGADPGFSERRLVCIEVLGVRLAYFISIFLNIHENEIIFLTGRGGGGEEPTLDQPLQ